MDHTVLHRYSNIIQKFTHHSLGCHQPRQNPKITCSLNSQSLLQKLDPVKFLIQTRIKFEALEEDFSLFLELLWEILSFSASSWYSVQTPAISKLPNAMCQFLNAALQSKGASVVWGKQPAPAQWSEARWNEAPRSIGKLPSVKN